MKTRNLLAAGFAASVLALAAAPAHAAPVGFAQASSSFAGSFSAMPPADSFSFGTNTSPTQLPPGAFTHNWIFDLSPTALSQYTISFTPFFPSLGITGFTANIFNTTGFTCATVSATCGTEGTLGSQAIGGTLGGFVSTGVGTLSAGTYALQISGTVVGTTSNYTGQMAFQQVPEPGSLALLGLGLAGLAAATRRKQKQA